MGYPVQPEGCFFSFHKAGLHFTLEIKSVHQRFFDCCRKGYLMIIWDYENCDCSLHCLPLASETILSAEEACHSGFCAGRLWSDTCSLGEKSPNLLWIADTRRAFLLQLYLDCLFPEQNQNSAPKNYLRSLLPPVTVRRKQKAWVYTFLMLT